MVSPSGERGWNNQATDFRITIEGVVEQLLLDLKGLETHQHYLSA
jgi:hypothetical protein